MVGSAGNAPARHFQLCLTTPDLQAGSRITSPKGATYEVSRDDRAARIRLTRRTSHVALELVAGVGVAPT